MEGRPVVIIIIIAQLKNRARRQAVGKNLIISTITGRPNGVIAIYIQIGRIEALAGSYRRQLAGLAMPLVELPIMYTRDFGPEQIGALGDRLLEQSR